MDSIDDTELMRQAHQAGLTLMQRETDLGQTVWSWVPTGRGSPGPQFLTRREAFAYLRERDGSPFRPISRPATA